MLSSPISRPELTYSTSPTPSTGFSPISKQLRFRDINTVPRSKPSYINRPIFKTNSSKKGFQLFPKLPVEIRHMIWRLALPGPRVVQVEASANLDIFQPRCSIPSILQVNQESREVAMKVLTPCFQTSYLKGAYTFFDLENDVLRLGYGNDVDDARSFALAIDGRIARDRKRVRHVEVPFSFEHSAEFYHGLAAAVCMGPSRGWPGLKTWSFSGAVWNGGNPKKMVVLEVRKELDHRRAARSVKEIEEAIRCEMREIFKEGMAEGAWSFELGMPDVGLKVVYIEEEDDIEE